MTRNMLQHYIMSAVISTILLLATRVIIDLGEVAAYVLCAVAAGASLAWYFLAENSASMHFLAVSLATLYQSHFVIEHVHAEWWLEAFMCSVAVVVYSVDYYIWYLSGDRTTEIPQDARRWYHVIANVVLGAMTYIPLHGAGMFNVKHTGLLGILAVLQFGLGITENMRNIPSNFFRMPNPAIKCLALLYLPPRDWGFFAFFLLVNILVIWRKSKKNKDKEGGNA